MYADSSSDFIKRAIELEVTALCGLMNDRSSLVSPVLNGAVLCSYALRVVTGHKFRSSGKQGKKKFAIGFPCLDCFASVRGANNAPSGLNSRPVRSRFDKSVDLEGRVKAKSIVTLL